MGFIRTTEAAHNGTYRLLHILNEGVAFAEGDFLFTGTDGSPDKAFFIGQWDGIDCYVTDSVPDEDHEVRGHRQLVRELREDSYAIVATAKQRLHWEKRNKFCPSCGGPTEPVPGESAVACTRCEESYYPVIAPVVMVAVEKEGRILLANNAMFPKTLYSVIAGFVEIGESLEEAACREVHEEVGIEIKNLRYFSSQAWPFPSGLITAFRAEYKSGDICCDGEEILQAQWFAPDALPQVPVGSISKRLIDDLVADLVGRG